METDRPDFTESTSVVPKGHVQLETGYTYSRNVREGVQSAHRFPEALLRAGVIGDRVELRVGLSYSRREAPVDQQVSVRSAPKTSIRPSQAREQRVSYWRLCAQVTLPTGVWPLVRTSRARINLVYAWDAIPARISVAGVQAILAACDNDGPASGDTVLLAGYTLTGRLGAFTEWWAMLPTGGGPDGAAHYADAGLQSGFAAPAVDIRAERDWLGS
jgi:hypothetical protein